MAGELIAGKRDLDVVVELLALGGSDEIVLEPWFCVPGLQYGHRIKLSYSSSEIRHIGWLNGRQCLGQLGDGVGGVS